MKTVRVRVFVSVSSAGGWAAYGGNGLSEEKVKEEAAHYNGIDGGYWIEADLPIPGQSPEIVATVTRAE